MTEEEPADAEPWTIAVHEAGHLAVGILLGRKPEKVAIEFVEGKRGCFWLPDDDWNDFCEVASLLAGPRAQVELCPESLPKDKLEQFHDKIIHPMPYRLHLPEGLYDFTGWQHDIMPIYQRLCLPAALARGMPLGYTHGKVVDVAEERVRQFCKHEAIKDSLLHIASKLHALSVVDHLGVEEIITASKLRQNDAATNLLRWD